MSAAPSGRFTTRSAIEDLTTSDFADAAARWRTAADQSDEVFDRHRQNIAAPGGTTWEGGAKDVALERVTADGVVARDQNGVVRKAAGIAETAVTDINAAQREVLAAITEAEDDGFTVAEDLKVTDARRYDINTVLERNKAAKEYAEDIRWYAERLGQTVAFAEGRLQEKAGELDAIRFGSEGESRDGEPTVRLVDNKVVQDKPDEDRKDEPGDKPAEQATGQVGPFAVPKAVEDAAKKPEDKPATTGDAGGDLGDLLGANDTLEGKPEDGQAAKLGDEKPAGLPPVLSQVPPPPDKATIDRQAAKVEAARQALDAAQTKANDAAVDNVTQGAGAGPSRDTAHDLGQAVFDARAELTEQTRILNELTYASAAAGGPTAPVAPLPENADVQAFPKEPPVLERAAGAFGEGMKDASKTVWDATMPDVGNMHHVATDWEGATPTERTQAIADAAGMVPLPGAKILGEGVEHGLDALGGVARHVDDAPTPHVDVDPPPTPHTQVDDVPPTHTHVDDVPSGGHGPVHTDTGDVSHHSADTPSADHTADAGHGAPYGVEDTGALLTASENAGGHLIERHVGQTFDDLSARLDSTRLPVVSSFDTADQAASAVSSALQHNQQTLDEWISNGAVGKLELDAPFSGGEVLRRGADEAMEGNGVRVVLKGDGTGGWHVLTGFPTP
ncbi:RNase A-like domain-containing protein [Mycobacterium sp. DBP42]|uniref:RNase A-like domain-containing protein n=1 Tax=Mycobacterium sp. DBP42 TaxID=2545267 RepID=UPI001486BD94|nr:RNase A-like domain-containing protein [Mycobacterium sp. DBP42]